MLIENESIEKFIDGRPEKGAHQWAIKNGIILFVTVQ